MRVVAYLAGVVKGDAWCTRVLGLRVADEEFSQSFCDALKEGFGVDVTPKRDERGYWLVRVSNKTGRFDCLRDYAPKTKREMAVWLRGLFDSEGNATLRLNGVSEKSCGRRVAIYSTEILTLEIAGAFLAILEIPTVLRPIKNSAGHKGQKPVFELSVRGNKVNYSRFARIIGSSITRKQSVLSAIPRSYQPTTGAHYRRGQLKGARAKRERTLNVTVPQVALGVKALILAGIKPTQRNCRSIPGFNTIQRYVAQSELVALANQQ